MHVKFDDWPTRLSCLIHSARERAFSWGDHDCLAWAAATVEAQCGVDDLADLRPRRYKTAKGAALWLRRNGVERTEELTDRLWGPRQHVSRAKLGDVVAGRLGDPELGLSLGLCYGRNSLFVGVEGGRHGLVTLDTLSLEHCYTPWASYSKQ